jgi:hypothetical protein
MNFTILKGSHYSNGALYKLLNLVNTKNELAYLVKFDRSCIYDLGSSDNEDINKLFGYSLGWNHHVNSARFGWNSKLGKINIYSYVYDREKRISNLIDTLDTESEHLLKLTLLDDNWIFEVDGKVSQVEVYQTFKTGYKLWPYFGGNIVAPNDMSIELSRVF